MGETDSTVTTPSEHAPQPASTVGPPSVRPRGFLFADLRDYTSYVDTRGDHAGAALLERYRAVVRGAVAAWRGAEIRTEGDSFYVVFESASAAVRCGLEILTAAKTAAGDPIRVGVGVHAGETVETTEGFVGSAVNIAARLCAQAGAGDLVVSDTVRALTRTYLDVNFAPLGLRRLKGVSEPIAAFRVEGRAPSGPDISASRHNLGRAPRRGALAVGGLIAGALVLTLAGRAMLGAGRSAPTLVPGAIASAVAAGESAPAGSMTGPSTAPSAGQTTPPSPSASVGPFPDTAEQALLAELKAVPGGFVDTCGRGTYAQLVVPVGSGAAAPAASLSCAPGPYSGANDVTVRKFGAKATADGFPSDYLSMLVAAHVITRQGPNGQQVVVRAEIPPGDCARSANANGTWTVAGQYRGMLVCFVDAGTATAYLEWTYDAEGILVTAVNQRGDSAALYGLFERIHLFIGDAATP